MESTLDSKTDSVNLRYKPIFFNYVIVHCLLLVGGLWKQ